MFPSNFASLKRPLPAQRQESDEQSWHSSFKRLKVNEDHNNQDGDDNASYNSQNNLATEQHLQLPAGQDSFEAARQPQYQYYAGATENMNGRNDPSLYATTINVPNLALNQGTCNSNYQGMNSFLGQLHLQRRLQQQLQRQQLGPSGPATPRTSNIHHHHQEQQPQQEQQQIQRQLFQEQQEQRLAQPLNQLEQLPPYFASEAAAYPLPAVRCQSAENPQQPDSATFPSSSTMSSLSSGSPTASLSTTTMWRPHKSKLQSDSKLF